MQVKFPYSLSWVSISQRGLLSEKKLQSKPIFIFSYNYSDPSFYCVWAETQRHYMMYQRTIPIHIFPFSDLISAWIIKHKKKIQLPLANGLVWMVWHLSCSIEQKSLKQGVKVALKMVEVIAEGRKWVVERLVTLFPKCPFRVTLDLKWLFSKLRISNRKILNPYTLSTSLYRNTTIKL